MKRHVHVLPDDRLESECVRQVLEAAGVPTRGRMVDSGHADCGGIVALALQDSSVRSVLVQLQMEPTGVPVLLVLRDGEEGGLGQADARGSAVVRSNQSTTEFVSAVRALLAGDTIAAGDADATATDGSSSEHLTRRELEVASLVSGGWRNEEIAGELGISVHTVRTHVNRVLMKLGVQHRVALRAKMQRRGHVPRQRLPVDTYDRHGRVGQ